MTEIEVYAHGPVEPYQTHLAPHDGDPVGYCVPGAHDEHGPWVNGGPAIQCERSGFSPGEWWALYRHYDDDDPDTVDTFEEALDWLNAPEQRRYFVETYKTHTGRER